MPESTERKQPSRGAKRTTRAISERLAERIGQHKYEMWFGHTAWQIEGNRLEVATASQFVAKWIDAHFVSELRGIAQEELGKDADIAVRVAPDLFGRRDADETIDTDTPPSRGRRRRKPRVGKELAAFVTGACNELALNAAKRLVDDPEGSVISPLFVHGECGVGKSHVLQGAAHAFAKSSGRPSRARYLTGEQFTNEYVNAVRHGTLDEFRSRIRKLDFFAVDDVHFLSNKMRTQLEFLHTIDALGLTGARIMLASDEHPRLIKRFNQALISRFLSGMVVRVDRPDRETRVALIERLATARGLIVRDGALDLLTANCVGSVRELEGAVTKLAALKTLADQNTPATKRSKEVGLVLAEQVFKDHGWQSSTPVRIGTIIDAVCDRLSVSRNDLMGSGRHRRVVLGRGLVAHLGRELTTLSYPEIAQALGRSYHSTVHTAAQRLRRQMEADEQVDLGGGERPLSLRELTDQLRHEIRRRTMRAN